MEIISLNTQSAEERYQSEPLDYLSPEKVFDAKWAVTLLDEAMSRLRQEYTAHGNAPLFEALRPYLDPINNGASLCYEDLANSLQVSAGSIKIQIHRLRKQCAFFLRQEVARTVCEAAEVDEEIHSLCEVLIAAQGQLDS